MMIFLYGQDAYRSLQKLNEIIAGYLASGKSRITVASFDADRQEFSEIREGLMAKSMFAEKKLIVIKNPFAKKLFQEEILEHLGALEGLDDIIVLHENEPVDERLKLFKKLAKGSKCQEFKPLEGLKLKQWVQHEFEKCSAKANLDATDLLIQYAGNDSWRLSCEIQKLASYKHGETVRRDDVKLLVSPRIEVEIFRTIDALAQRNKRQALHFLKKHQEQGDNPLYLLSMVAYQIKNLLLVKELAQQGLMYASIVKKSGLHPFVVKKTYFMCNQFSLEELKKIYRAIFAIDTDIKKGRVEPETALELLVATM